MWDEFEWAAVGRLSCWALCCIVLILIGHFKKEWACRKWQSMMFWYILMAIILLKDGDFANSNAAIAVYIITGIITTVFHIGDRLENIMFKKGDTEITAKINNKS